MKLARRIFVVVISFAVGLGLGWFYVKPDRLRFVNQLSSGTLTVRFTYETREGTVTHMLPDIPAQSFAETAFTDVTYINNVEGMVGDKRFPAPGRKLLRRSTTVYTLTENGWTVEPKSW